MRAVLLTGFAIFVLADVLLSAAVIYHLRQFTMPGWSLRRGVIVLYLTMAGALLGAAGYYFLQINPNDIAVFIERRLPRPGYELR